MLRRWPRTDISEPRGKVMRPWVRDTNAAPAVSWILWIVRIHASIIHRLPDGIFRDVRHTPSPVTVFQSRRRVLQPFFQSLTTARCTRAVAKMSDLKHALCSTIAATEKHARRFVLLW